MSSNFRRSTWQSVRKCQKWGFAWPSGYPPIDGFWSGKSHLEMDDWGYPPFMETSISMHQHASASGFIKIPFIAASGLHGQGLNAQLLQLLAGRHPGRHGGNLKISPGCHRCAIILPSSYTPIQIWYLTGG